MYINSNHLRVVKLLQGISNPNLQFIGELLNIGESNVIQYIKTVYKYIETGSSSFKKQEMIDAVRKEKNLVDTLREFQEITKEERQVYIIFSLLLYREVNLTEFAELFAVTRRSLNNDIIEIKEIFANRQLEILSDNFKGIRLIGKEDTITKLLNNFLYKIWIELEELPKILQDIYKKYYEKKNYPYLLEESDKFISEMQLNRYFNIQHIYGTFAMTFIDPDKNTLKIKDLASHEEFYTFSKESFNEEYSKKLFQSLKNSYFGNFSVYEMQLLMMFIKVSNGDFYLRDEEILEEAEEYRRYFQDKMEIDLQDNEEFNFHITRMIYFSKSNFDLKLKDFTFLSLNLNNAINDELMEIYLYLKSKMSSVGFTLTMSMFFYLSYLKENKREEKKESYLLYKSIPENIINMVVNKLERQHGLKIMGTVNFNRLNSFMESEKPDNFIILEKFIYENSRIDITYLPFPL